VIGGWVRRVRGKLGQPGFLRSTVALAGATVLAQALTLAAMPLVTRLYTPAELGVVTLFLAFFSFWAAILSLRYESALLVAEDAETRALFQLSARLVILLSVAALPVLWLGRSFGLLGLGLLPAWACWLAVPIFAGYGLFMVYRAMALRAGLVRALGTATLLRSGANAAARVALGAGGLGVAGLFIAELAGAVAPALALLRAARPQIRGPAPTKAELSAVRRRYEKFPRFELPSTAVNQAAAALPVPILAALHGPAAAGWYGLAALLVALPNAQIGKAVSDSFQIEFARTVREGRFDQARRLFRKVVAGLALGGLVPYLAIMLLAPIVVVPLFGPDWSEVARIAVVLSPWLYAAFVVSSVSTMLLVVQAQQLKLVYDVAALAANAGVYALAQWQSFDLHATIVAFTAANTACDALYLMVQFFALERALGPGAAVRAR